MDYFRLTTGTQVFSLLSSNSNHKEQAHSLLSPNSTCDGDNDILSRQSPLPPGFIARPHLPESFSVRCFRPTEEMEVTVKDLLA